MTVLANSRAGKKNAAVSEEPKPVMSPEDLRRYETARAVLSGDLTIERAALLLAKSPRQMRRIVSRVKKEGETGVVHKLRGRASNRRLPNEVRRIVLKIYTKSCKHLGLTAAKNAIWRQSKIRVNRETLRRWLIAAGLRSKREDHRPSSGLVFFGASYASK